MHSSDEDRVVLHLCSIPATMPRHIANSNTIPAKPSLPISPWKLCQRAASVATMMLLLVADGSAQSPSGGAFQPLQQTIKVLSTNLDGFGIPFKVDDQRGQFIEVQLYMSQDQGKTWSFHSRQPTSAREFPFTADGDGEYWFAIKTLDRDRRLLPDGNARPELKIIVDSDKPKLEFQIQSDAAGRVACRWQASDKGLNAKSLKIEYRASAGELLAEPVDEAWKSVPVELDQDFKSNAWSDQLAWWPDVSNTQLEVRMRIADMAGNETKVSRYVAVKRASWRSRSSGSTLNQARSSAVAPNPIIVNESASWQPRLKPLSNTENHVTEMALPTNNRWRINETAQRVPGHQAPLRVASNQLPPGVELVDPPEPSGQPTTPTFGQSRNSVAWESEIQRHESSDRSFMSSTMAPAPDLAPLQQSLPARVTDSIPSNPATSIRSGKNVISESTTSWPDNQWNGPTSAKVQPNSALTAKTNGMVPIRRSDVQAPRRDEFTHRPGFSNAGFRKTQKEPAIDSRPQSVVSETMPQSANTQIISTKRFQLNYDINAIDPSGVGQVDLWMTRDRGQSWKLWGQDPDNVSPFPVEVNDEGIYGFRIVVRSKDGLAGRGPMRGEEADMWVQVDVTAPLTKITSVPYGRGSEAGQLVINYAASDSNLTLRPNRILWSTNPDGPWTTIEENLRNESRLLWKPGQNVPKRVFLRLESADRAGNVGVHNLEQAIDISGLIPRGTIFGVVPVGE